MRRVLAGTIFLLLLASRLLAAQPELAISLNDSIRASIQPGWPLLVQIFIANPDATEEILLAPKDAAWPRSVRLVLLGKDLQTHTTTFTLTAEPPSPVLKLPPGASTSFFYALDEAATAQIAPGSYRVGATLEIRLGTGWKGLVQKGAAVEVVPEAALDAASRLKLALLRARLQILRRDTAQAKTILKDHLQTDPKSVPALRLLAEVLEDEGDATQAYFNAERALRLQQADPKQIGLRPEPPVALNLLRRRLWQKLLAAEPPVSPKTGVAMATAQLAPEPVSISTPSPAAVATSKTKKTLPSTPPPSAETLTIVPSTEIDEASILSDPRGQWAAFARASSEYGTDSYNALQTIGAPNVETYSDNPNAWCHSGSNSELEWLEVYFSQPVQATELRVRQNYTPGTITKIEAFAADGRVQVLWEGVDTNRYLPNQIAWFVLRFPTTTFPVKRVKLTLNVSLISGWKQIDAVQLVSDALSTTPESMETLPSTPPPSTESLTIVPYTDLDEGNIFTDPRGQWASTASASSEYGTDRYNALQATGAPNVAAYSDNPNSWCHSGANSRLEWLEVGFAQTVYATELRVRQNHIPGTIAKVEAFAADGRVQVLWEGADPNSYTSGQIAWFALRFPATPFPVQRVKLTLNIALIPGWKQIDAVQLVGDAP